MVSPYYSLVRLQKRTLGEMAETRDSCAEPPPPRVWDTGAVGRGEAFDYYREGICAAFMPLRPEVDRDHRKTFSANVTSYDLGDTALNLVHAASHLVCKGRAEIAASPIDCYYLNHQLQGECRISQNGETITLRQGETGIFDGTSAFELEHRTEPTLGVASLLVPKRLLRDMPWDGSKPFLLSHHPMWGNLLNEAARTLRASVGRASAEERVRLSSIVCNLASMCAAPDAAAPATRSAAQFERVRSAIRDSCRDADFDVAGCTAITGLSASYIHELFARNGDRFGACLLRERLKVAAGLLRDPALRHLPVTSLAYLAGFRDASHFSRVFRRAYGCPPGAWRRSGLLQ